MHKYKKILLFPVLGTLAIIFSLSIIISPQTHAASAPPAPSITGPTSGAVGGSYSYTITLHPHQMVGNGDTMIFDNGNGGYGSRGFYSGIPSSGLTIQFNASWQKPGTYNVRAEVQDAGGTFSAWSSAIAVTITPDTTPPTVPTFFYGGASSTSQVDLTFGNSTDNVSVAGYKIYRNGSLVGSAAGRTSDSDGHSYGQYSDTGLTPGTKYTYTSAAYDAVGNLSAQSAPVSFTTYSLPYTTAPSAPTNLAATVISSSQINLSWTASTDNVGVTGYQIFRNGISIAATASGLSYSDTSVIGGTTYSYTVDAYDAAGNTSPQSNAASATTTAAPLVSVPDTDAPSAPTGVTVTVVSSSQINISWNASTDNVGVTRYDIYNYGGFFVASTTELFYSAMGLSPSTSYAYSVIARDAAGNMSYSSNQVTATTLDAPTTPTPNITPTITPTLNQAPDTTPPTVPMNVSAVAASSSQINLIWASSLDTVGVVGYKILRNGVSIDSSNDTSYSDAGLLPGTKYSYTVAAYDAAGNTSAPSTPVSATTPAAPTTPTPNKNPDIKTPTAPTNETKVPTVDVPPVLVLPPAITVPPVVTQDVFLKTLRIGSRGDEVKALQKILISEGVYKGPVTGRFDQKTKMAVKKFQEKYQFDILTPMGLKKGNGVVGATTRDKLNALSAIK